LGDGPAGYALGAKQQIKGFESHGPNAKGLRVENKHPYFLKKRLF